MPRTKLSAQADAQKEFVILIKSKCYALYGSVAQAAPHTGSSQATLSRRLRDVDSFSIKELRDLRKAVKLSKEDMLAALDGFL